MKKKPQEAAGHNSGPLKQTILVDQSAISSERKFWNFKVSSEKDKTVKETTLAKEKERECLKKTHPRKAAGHNSGPLLTTNTHYLGSIYFLIIGDFQILKYSIKICLKKYKNKK